MSGSGYLIADSSVMLGRNLRRLRRYPLLTLLLIAMPIVFLALFVYVFGSQLGAGLHGLRPLASPPGRRAYLQYVVPGVLIMAVASAVQATAIVVATDMTTGIVNRFRTMSIARASVLAGHVLASLLQTLLCVAVVLGVSVALGFRPHASVAAWLAATAVIVLFALALIWLAVALGLAARSVETASNTPMFLTLLPFLGSGFVRTSTMPAGLRQFAEYQPFTPVTDTIRGLLGGGQVGGHVLLAVGWSVAIAVASCAWAIRLYRRPRGFG